MTANGVTGVSGPPLLELRDVRACYGKVEVLHGVDLVVPAGQVVALLGPNGAGKTTTLNVAAGVHPPSGGEVLMAGRRITGAPADRLARRGVCTIPEGRGVFPNLTVRENLRMALSALPGVQVFPSAANFLLLRVQANGKSGDAVFANLLEHKVLVKNVGKMHMLLENCLRVTVGTPEENALLIDALRAALLS